MFKLIDNNKKPPKISMPWVVVCSRGRQLFADEFIRNCSEAGCMVVGFTYNQYTITGTIMKSQEKILTKVVTLVAFIPLLTGAGVDVGAQSSTVVIGGMNIDEMRSLGTLQVVDRETMSDDDESLSIYAGALLGGMLGAIATF
jgi:magnesium transporter